MAAKAADGGSEGQIAVTEDELRELNNQVNRTSFLWLILIFLFSVIQKKIKKEQVALKDVARLQAWELNRMRKIETKRMIQDAKPED